MSERSNIKEQIKTRSFIVYMVFVLFVAYLLLKLSILLFINNDEWKQKISPIAVALKESKPSRGNIYDVNGKLLATSVSFFDIHMDTRAGGLTDEIFNKNVDSLAYYLSNFFKDKTKNEYKRMLVKARKKGKRYLEIAKRVTYDEYIEIKEFPLFRLNSNKGGFLSKKTTIRQQPFKGLAKRTIGLFGEDRATGIKQGKAGLEYTYNRELGGRAGKAYMKKIAGGNWTEIKGGEVLEKENGLDLITAIDINLQDYVDNILKKQLSKLKAEYGSVVVMEVKTGYIKAIANIKRYPNNTFGEVLNYAVGENLAPGSTFKLPVLMAALEDGFVDLDDIIDTGNGHIVYHGVPVDDAGNHAFGKIPVWEVFAKSSNVGMLKIVDDNYVKKGRIERFLKQLNSIGIGDISGVDIYGENKPTIKTPQHIDWAPSTPGMIAHGYEVRISPLQLLTFYNAVANDGVMVKPQIVTRIEKDGLTVKEYKPIELNPLICSKETLKKAKRVLRAVVEEGTAKAINTKQYKISGKTGTTEYYDAKLRTHNGQYRASFAGFFPSDNPKYSIIVVINRPQTDYYGALAAAPVFKKIADEIFKRDRELNPPKEVKTNQIKTPLSKNGNLQDLKIVLEETSTSVKNSDIKTKWVETEAQKENVVLKRKNIEKNIMPDLKYMGAKDAVYILEKLGLQAQINGRGFVVNQSIVAGDEVKKGMKVKLELN
ncbi:MAG: transpeptidase family protein [Chlorobi bacterium]|nr:transpeptidase family protein [Chlorobiota bacterium]